MDEGFKADIEANGFKYYIFDWDDNILHMPTHIHLEHRQDDGTWTHIRVSTSTFAIVRTDTDRYRPPNGDWEQAFVEFRDFEHLEESQFLADTRAALKPVVDGLEEGAPSFKVFRRALTEGRLLAIVTARGHKPGTLRKGVEQFIDTVLTQDERTTMVHNLESYFDYFEIEREGMSPTQLLDEYLSLNKYHAVTSPEFLDFLKGRGYEGGSGAGQEEAKKVAIKDFVDHVLRILREHGVEKPVSIGFSDDDPHNVAAVQNYVEGRLSEEFPGVKFVVYDTSDPDIPNGRKVVVRGQLELGL